MYSASFMPQSITDSVMSVNTVSGISRARHGWDDSRMDAATARTTNIRLWVAEAGGPAEFARRYGGDDWVQAQVSQWTSQSRPKGIGNKLAREIERRLGKSPGSMDQEPGHSNEGKPPPYLRQISVWNDPNDLDPGLTVLFPKLDYYLSAGHGGPDPDAVEQTDKTLPFSVGWAKARGWSPRTHFTMRATGHSMEPTIQHNAPVVVDTSPSGKMLRSGKVYAVLLDGEPLLKRLQRLPNGRIQVISDNPAREFSPYDAGEEELSIIGRAVWTPSEL